MKKAIVFVLALALLLCTAPAVFAAGSAAWRGPSMVRSGDTIEVTFYASGGIYGGSGSVSYNSSQLTLQKYKQDIGGNWVVEFSGNSFVFYDNAMSSPIVNGTAIFTAVFTVNSSVEAGTAISVTASGITLSDGQQDIPTGSSTYSVTVSPPLSGNCNLASLNVSNASISPAFSPSVTSYSASVPFSVSALNISATAEHSGAKVSVGNTGLVAGGTTIVKVTVTAENGATKTYSIKVAREQDPNYVKSSNADLSALAVEGYVLSPAFQPDVQQYYVWLPYEAESVSLQAETADNLAALHIGTYEALLPGEGTPVSVTVTAEDGTEKIYTVTVVRAPAHEDVNAFLNPEPETEPVTEPVTEPPVETAPVVEEEPVTVSTGFSGFGMAITCISCAIAGAGILMLVLAIALKKKSTDKS